MPLRATLFVAALSLIVPGIVTDAIGLALGLAVLLAQRWRIARA